MTRKRCPVRLLDAEDGPDGRVEVLRPKFGTGRLGRWLSGRLSRPHLRVRLDDTGSFVWRLCDGEHTVEQIAGALREHEGKDAPDVAPRLEWFLGTMTRRGMIGWR